MLITSCNHEKSSRLGTYCTHSVLNRRKRRAGGITICPDYIRPPRPNRSQCPDSCIRPYPEFWPFCPDKIRHRPSQEDDFVRIVYEAFKRHCRGSWKLQVTPLPRQYTVKTRSYAYLSLCYHEAAWRVGLHVVGASGAWLGSQSLCFTSSRQ